MRFLAPAAIALAAIASPAFAQDTSSSFDGPYIGAVGGYESITDGTTSQTGALGGVVAGVDFKLGGSAVAGIEGQASLSTTEDCSGTGAARDCVEATRDLYVGGRIGLLEGGNTLIYLGAGYTNAGLRETLGGNEIFSDSYNGIRGKFGVESLVAGNIGLRGEVAYSNYEDGIERFQATLGVTVHF
jgi:outer membrane immunogenic protein